MMESDLFLQPLLAGDREMILYVPCRIFGFVVSQVILIQFNRAMRFKANKMGYSLNQRGLFQGVVRDPHDRRIKTNAGK
jgi:hypothetical protein